MSRSVIGHTLVTLLALAGTVAVAQAQSWQVGSAPTFLSGTYGAESRTDIFYAPITAKRIFRDGDLTLVFPFLCVRGAAGVTVVGDSPIRTGGAGATTTTVTTTTRPAASGTRTGSTTTSTRGTTADAAPATPQNACGIGDIVVRGRYYVVDEHAWLPTIALRAHLKAPTADAERGLGTGRPDEGVGVEVTRSMGRGLSAMVDGGYTLIGEPEGLDFNRPWWYDVGLGQDLARGMINVSVFFEDYRAIVPGLPNARDVLAALTIKGRGGWQAQVSAQFGASDGAPEHGVTLGLSRRF